MALKKPKERISRKELLREPDEFLTFSAKAIKWGRAHERQITIGVTIFVVILLAVVAVRYFMARTERTAYRQFAIAQQTFVKAQQPEQDEEAVLDRTSGQIAEVLEEHPKTKAGRLATFVAGWVAYEKGDYEKSLSYYEDAGQRYKKDPQMHGLALVGQGYAAEQLGQYERAQKAYEQALAIPESGVAEVAGLGVARMLEAQGMTDEAVAAYERFLDDNPDSAHARLAKEFVARHKR